MATRTTRADFEAVISPLIKDIVASAQDYGVPANALEWFEKV
jgi:hypothetical protein